MLQVPFEWFDEAASYFIKCQKNASDNPVLKPCAWNVPLKRQYTMQGNNTKHLGNREWMCLFWAFLGNQSSSCPCTSTDWSLKLEGNGSQFFSNWWSFDLCGHQLWLTVRTTISYISCYKVLQKDLQYVLPDPPEDCWCREKKSFGLGAIGISDASMAITLLPLPSLHNLMG